MTHVDLPSRSRSLSGAAVPGLDGQRVLVPGATAWLV